MCIATSHMHVSGLCSYCLAGLESICKVAHIRVFLSLRAQCDKSAGDQQIVRRPHKLGCPAVQGARDIYAAMFCL